MNYKSEKIKILLCFGPFFSKEKTFKVKHVLCFTPSQAFEVLLCISYKV
jgi:hypothetical protein